MQGPGHPSQITVDTKKTPRTMQTRADWLRHGSKIEDNINVKLVVEHSAPCGQTSKDLRRDRDLIGPKQQDAHTQHTRHRAPPKELQY